MLIFGGGGAYYVINSYADTSVRLNCPAGQIQSKSTCKKADRSDGCLNINNGKACKDGAHCDRGYAPAFDSVGSAFCRDVPASAPARPAPAPSPAPAAACHSIDHGVACNDGRIACSSGYIQSKSECKAADSGSCITITNGRACSDGAHCNANYVAARDHVGSAYCAPAPAAAKPATPAPAAPAPTATAAAPATPLTCPSGYVQSKSTCKRATTGSCITITNGKACPDGAHCNAGYTPARDHVGSAFCAANPASSAAAPAAKPTAPAAGKSAAPAPKSSSTTKSTAHKPTGSSGSTNARGSASPAAPSVKCSDISHGKRCANGKVTCDRGFDPKGNGCQLDNTEVVEYSGHGDDGCGSNAIHVPHDRNLHVGRQNFGANSRCRCTNNTYVDYGAPISSSTVNTKCANKVACALTPYGYFNDGRKISGAPCHYQGKVYTENDHVVKEATHKPKASTSTGCPAGYINVDQGGCRPAGKAAAKSVNKRAPKPKAPVAASSHDYNSCVKANKDKSNLGKLGGVPTCLSSTKQIYFMPINDYASCISVVKVGRGATSCNYYGATYYKTKL